jgi:hypothetical protein
MHILPQALMYLTISTNGAGVQWLTAQQLTELLASKPPATSAVPGLRDSSPGQLLDFVAVRILDRRLFLQSMAQVESERKWGQKHRTLSPDERPEYVSTRCLRCTRGSYEALPRMEAVVCASSLPRAQYTAHALCRLEKITDLPEDDMLMLADKFRSQASRHG